MAKSKEKPKKREETTAEFVKRINEHKELSLIHTLAPN